MSLGGHRPHSPPRPGRLGAPFYPQGLDPIHASISQIAAELKQVSARVTQLEEAQAEHTKIIEQIHVRLDTLETRLNALESGAAGGVQDKKSGGSSRGGSNKHLLLKVSHRRTLPETLC